MINSSATYIPEEDGPSPYNFNPGEPNSNINETPSPNIDENLVGANSDMPQGINPNETYIDPSNMMGGANISQGVSGNEISSGMSQGINPNETYIDPSNMMGSANISQGVSGNEISSGMSQGINPNETYIDPSNIMGSANISQGVSGNGSSPGMPQWNAVPPQGVQGNAIPPQGVQGHAVPPQGMQGNAIPPQGVQGNAIPPQMGGTMAPRTNLNKGATIGESYIVNSQLEGNGKQSDIYLVRRDGKVYVAKIYRRGWQPAKRVKEFFKTCNHPNIASVLDFGSMLGNYYEIYEYYHEKTLEEFKNSNMNFIRKILVPGLNEGLHELHSQGIIHCDIKPSNIFLADDASRVVIGDFGSTGVMGSDGKASIVLQGTPEYSAPVTAFYGNASVTPAYDYCSFGLVLYKMVTGHSLLGNTTTQEIAKIWQRGIKLPVGMNSRMAELISGLIEIDEDKRWGYKEVKRWCEDEFISQKKVVRRRKEEDVVKPLIFGNINGDIVRVTTITKLVNLMRENWEQAKVVVRRIETEYFIKHFNSEAALYLKELKKLNNDDEVVFKLIYKLEMSERIYFRGHDYGTLQSFLDKLAKNDDKDAIEFIGLGLFVHYLVLRKADTRMIEQLNRLIAQSGTAMPDTSSIMAICFAFISDKELKAGDETITSIGEFIDYIYRLDIKRIRELIVRDDVLAWLYTMGLGSNVTVLSKMED